MTPEEWKSFTDKEKHMFRKGFKWCLDFETNLDHFEKMYRMEKLDKYLKAMENQE